MDWKRLTVLCLLVVAALSYWYTMIALIDRVEVLEEAVVAEMEALRTVLDIIETDGPHVHRVLVTVKTD